MEKNKTFRTVIVKKSKEWTVEKQVLGVVHKTDIHKPKALLEIKPIQKENVEKENESQLEKDRKILWNCRIYIDNVQTKLCSMVYPPHGKDRQEFQKEYFMENKTWEECMTFEKGRKVVRRVLERHLFPLQCLPEFFVCMMNWNPWRNSISMEQSRLLQLIHMILCSNNTVDDKLYISIRESLLAHFGSKESGKSLHKEVKDILKVFIVRGKEVCSASSASIVQVFEEWNRLEQMFQTLQ